MQSWDNLVTCNSSYIILLLFKQKVTTSKEKIYYATMSYSLVSLLMLLTILHSSVEHRDIQNTMWL